MADDLLKKNARLCYRFFALKPEVRKGQYQEFCRLWDSGRWHEAELMLEKLEKASGAASNG